MAAILFESESNSNNNISNNTLEDINNNKST